MPLNQFSSAVWVVASSSFYLLCSVSFLSNLAFSGLLFRSLRGCFFILVNLLDFVPLVKGEVKLDVFSYYCLLELIASIFPLSWMSIIWVC